MINFFQKLLAPAGWRCATIIQNGHAQNFFFQTNEELAKFIADYDAAGWNVYHACATFKTPESRKQTNIEALQSFFFDVDGGQDAVSKRTGYQNVSDCIHAVAKFCNGCKLPTPALVGSGGGLHVYWFLDRALPWSEWRRHADALKQAARQAGLHFDPARTADGASILRSPGTHNPKHGRAEVKLYHDAGSCSITAFEHLTNGQAQTVFTQDASYLARRKTNNACLLGTDYGDGPPRYSNCVAERCNQIRELRRTRGNLPEPVWYAALGVLAFAVDGDRYGHEWSTGDTRYTREETDRKLAQARRLSGPTTCQRFSEINPAGCQECPYFGSLTTPLQLGEEPEAQALLEHVNGHDFGDDLPIIPKPFEWRNRSLVLATGKPNGPAGGMMLSKYPIYLKAVDESEIRKEFSYTFRQFLPSKKWIEILVSAKDLFSPTGLGELVKHGATIHDSEQFKKFVRASVDMHHEGKRLGVRYDQYGWKEEGFLFGNKLYNAEGEHDAAGSEELRIRNTWLGPGCGRHLTDEAPSLDRWKRAANQLFAYGCEAQAVALLAAFAAPLMYFLSEGEGGVVVSLVNRASGTGKTTGLLAAASVWGQKDGLDLTNRDTNVTKFLSLAAMGNLPIIYDEIETKDPVVMRDFISDYTTGKDRRRATREGLIRHAAASWRNIMVTASNMSLVEILSHQKDTDALSYRVFEMESSIPPELKHKFGDKLKNELLANAGYAGCIYLRCLMRPNIRNQLRRWVEGQEQTMWEQTGFEPKHRFWVRLLTTISLAAVLVRKLDLLEISADRITEWLLKTMKDRFDMNRMDAAAQQRQESDTWAISALADFVGVMRAYTVIVQGDYRKNTYIRILDQPRDKPISARYESGSQRFTFTIDAMRKYAIASSIPFREWREVLTRKSLMSDVKQLTLVAGTDLPGAQHACFEVSLAHPLLGGVKTPKPESNVVILRKS